MLDVNEFCKKYIIPIIAFVAMGIISYFLFNKLNTIDDRVINSLERISAVESEIRFMKGAIEGFSLNIGDIKGSIGDNKLNVVLLSTKIDYLEKEVDEIKNNN